MAIGLFGKIEAGKHWVERAIAANPNLESAWVISGWGHLLEGLVEEADERLQRAIRLNPSDSPRSTLTYGALSNSCYFLGAPRGSVTPIERGERSKSSGTVTGTRFPRSSISFRCGFGRRRLNARCWTGFDLQVWKNEFISGLTVITPPEAKAQRWTLPDASLKIVIGGDSAEAKAKRMCEIEVSGLASLPVRTRSGLTNLPKSARFAPRWDVYRG